MHGTELLQMSCSTKQDMRSKLVMWLLQAIVFSWRQDNSKSCFASWGKIDKAQKCMLCIIIHFRIRIVWFQPKQDSDRIRISFFKNRIGSDSKIPLSDHLWYIVSYDPADKEQQQSTVCIYYLGQFLLFYVYELSHYQQHAVTCTFQRWPRIQGAGVASDRILRFSFGVWVKNLWKTGVKRNFWLHSKYACTE